MADVIRDNRRGNWFWMDNAIVDCYGKRLGVYGAAVYMALCRHAADGDQSTFVSKRTISDEFGCSYRQVTRELQKLTELGLIHVEEHVNKHGQGTNTYVLLSPPQDYQSLGVSSQSSPLGLPVPTPGTTSPSHEFNKTQLTKPMEQKRTDAWKTELAATMTASNYARWVAPLEVVELVNHHAVLSAPDTSTADYARTRLADTLARALNVERIEIQTVKGSTS